MPNYQPTPTDTSGNVKSAIQNSDTFNNLLVCERNNQVSVSFAKGQTLAPLNVTTTGGGGVTVAGGEATFSSGTAANGSVIATSKAVTSYIAGFSIYLLGSVGWQVPPTGANETAFFGLWDVVNDGIYIGYSGTTFGVAIMSGGVQSFTPRSEWNGDALDGGQSSSFTRDGLSEAIDFSFHNVFRIEFAWLGSGPIYFEVLSPDGQWVIFHTIRRPNISTLPSIENPNLPASIVITKVGADATNVTMTSSCWGAGTTAPNNQVVVTNFPATQPVSAASLPLPAGAATLAGQQTINTTLGSPAQQIARSNVKAVSGSIAVTAPATLFAAQAAGVYADLAGLVLTITQNANLYVKIGDGTNTYDFQFNNNNGTPICVNFTPPISAASAATAWTIALSATGATVYYVATFVLKTS